MKDHGIKQWVMVDKRLSDWAEQHGLCAKGQVGFRKDYHTTDQFFILWTLIEQSKAKKNHFIVILWTLKRRSILCRMKCYGMCWLALGWKGVSCDTYRRCMPRISYVSTTQAGVSPLTSSANKV